MEANRIITISIPKVNFYKIIKTPRKTLDNEVRLWHNNFVANADTVIFLVSKPHTGFSLESKSSTGYLSQKG